MAEAVKSRIDIQVTSDADKAIESLEKLIAAEGKAQHQTEGLTVASDKQTKIRERSEAAVDRLAKRYDQEYRAVERLRTDQESLNRAYNAGLGGTRAYELALAGIHRQQSELSRSANDNSRIDPFHHATEGANRFNSAVDRVQSFAWNNSSFSGNEIDRVVMPIRLLGATLGGLPAIAITAGAAAEGALALIGNRSQEALRDLQEVSRQSGLGVNQIAGAQIVGARSGLTQDQTRGALNNAGREFDAYRRNDGGVKSALENIDEGFLKVADRARNAGEFVDTIGEKIRALPREEGLDLSRKLFGEDAGARLFDNIRSGALSMRALGDEATRAGGINDELARKAEDVQRQIDEAAEVARTKLLVAFQDLGSPIDNLKLGWWGVVGSIGDAISRSEELRQVMQGLMHPIDTLANAPHVVGKLFEQQPPRPFGRLIDMSTQNDFDRMKGDFFARGPKLTQITASDTRARYAAREESDASGGKASSGRSALSAADRAEEKYTSITRQLQNQISLLVSQGAEHDRIALQIETERRLVELGVGATQAQKDGVSALVTKLDEAKKAQERLNEEAKKFNEAYSSASSTISGALKDILNGGKPGDALQKALQSMQGQLLDASLTGGGPYAKLFGLNGKDGAVGGLFGGLGDVLGLGPKSVGAMNVQAANVNINGGVGGLIGGGTGGGLLGSLFGGGSNFAGQPAGAMGPFQQSGGFLSTLISGIGSLFAFADGGVMTSHGPLPLRRYADGGIASSPQLAMYGEGSGPEAFVPLKSGGIPVNLNLPRGASVTPNAQSLAYARSLASGAGNANSSAQPAPKTEVHVHNAPAGTQTRETTDSRGNRRVEVVIGETVAAGLRSTAGLATLRGFGLRPSVARR